MSKSVKMIVGVVAAVAIPFAAPALASMVMASTAFGGALAAGATALGTTATSGLIGAGLGAASAAATGGDVGRGALFGGLGGGLGGLAKATQAAQAAQGAGQAGQAATTAATAAPVGTNTVLAPTAVAPGAAGAGAGAGAGLQTGFDTASYLSGITGSGSGTGAATGQLAGITGGGAGLSVPYSPSPAAVGAPAATPQASWGERFVDSAKGSWDKMTSPENVANMALEGGKYVAGSLAAGSGMTSAEEAMMRQQRQEMRRAQEANDAAYQQRRDEATKLLNEANYFDPNYMGLQRARDAQLQGARAKRAGLRGLDSPARQAEGRRYDLGTARATGSAYDEGYQTGVESRTRTRAAGLAALPTGYQTTTSDYATLANQANLAEERRRQRARDIGNLFGDFSGTRKSLETGG